MTTLEPGASGYAGLTVAFQGRTPNSDGGPSATPTRPAKGVYYDSALSVTYWQTDVESALG